MHQNSHGCVSDNEVGSGNTNAWRVASMDDNSTYAVFFEVSRGEKDAMASQNGMIQFQTSYQHSNGARVLRITTLAHTFADPAQGARGLVAGVDQEACAALLARIAVYKSEREDADSLRLLDTSLIKVCQRYADFHKGNMMSFQLPAELALYPQFMFYLRRGPLIQVFNNSPDETVFFRYCLLRETVSNCLIMIQPTLDSYTLDNDPEPVILSAHSVDPKNVLLLDTFFHVIVHYGETIASWRNAGYHTQPEYENLRELLEAPKLDAADLMRDRLPLPIYVETDQRGSQARFLIASLDPAITHKVASPGQQQGTPGEIVFTEDASLQTFIDKLKNLTVGEEK
jgi:protein transport protein SEC23